MPTGYAFTDHSAWEFIANKLESGHAFEMVTLTTPPGADALVMLVSLPNLSEPLYIKVEIGAGCKAIGRSFHISYR